MKLYIGRMQFIMPAIALLILPLTARAALAQNSSPTPPPSRSLTDEVMDKARRLHDYLNLMNDKDQAVRLAALQTALKDPNPVVHGMALISYLKRFDALTPEVALDSTGPVAPEDVPRLSMSNIKWSDDGSSFTGYYNTTCSGAVGLRGQIAGGKLSISFDGVCVRASLLTKDASGNQGKGDQLQLDACQLTMTPNEQGSMMEGPLHCVGMSAVLKVQLPFGA